MTLSKSLITGHLNDATQIRFTLSTWDSELAEIVLSQSQTFDLVDGNIPDTCLLWQNQAGLRGTSYAVTAINVGADGFGSHEDLGNIQIGTDAEYVLADLLEASSVITPGNTYNVLTDAEIADIYAALDDDLAAAVAARDAAAVSASEADASRLQSGDYADTAQTAAENAQASALTCATWAVLSGLTGATAGTGAEVLDADTGTHTDPVVGGSVANAGRYTWSASPTGWKWISATGLSSKANTTDVATEVAALLERAGGPTPVASSTDVAPIMRTADGYAFAWLDSLNSQLQLGGLRIGLLDIYSDDFTVATADGYEAFRVIASSGRVNIVGVSFVASEYTGLGVSTRDGYTSFLATGDDPVEFVAGPRRLTFGRPNAAIPGGMPGGIVTDVTRVGDYWQYRWNGNVVLLHDTADQWAPHLLDSPAFVVTEFNGQSWNCIDTNDPAELDYQDPTGMTRARLTKWRDPTVAVTRRATPADTAASPWHAANPWLKESDSTEIVPLSDFHRIPFPTRFSSGWVSAATRAHFQREFGLPQRACIAPVLGRSGNSADKFIPEGTSFTDTAGTVYPAALVSGATEYLWAVDVGVRAELAQIVKDKYQNRELLYDHLGWIQGTYTAAGAYRAFLDLFRTQQDLLNLPTVDGTGKRAIFIDQRAASYDEAQGQIGSQEQLEWAQANASGKDFLAGPRYQLRQRDGIHHTAYDVVRYAEVVGLAMALYELTGGYEPWWITGLTVSGSTVRVHTNAPIQGGAIVIDTTTLPLATGWGFQIRDADAGNALIALSSMAVDGSDIVLTYGETMAGRNLQFNYAFRGTVQTVGTALAPNISACWGNLRREGVYAAPFSVDPIHQWLCATRLNITA